MKKTELADKTAKKPRGKPFEKGNRANPYGRPKGSPNETTRFRKALEPFEKEKGKTLLKKFIEMAYTNPIVDYIGGHFKI